MVGVSGFEPEASWSRTKRDTKLRHTPIKLAYVLYHSFKICQGSFSDYFYLFIFLCVLTKIAV